MLWLMLILIAAIAVATGGIQVLFGILIIGAFVIVVVGAMVVARGTDAFNALADEGDKLNERDKGEQPKG